MKPFFSAKGIANQCFYLDGLTRINTKLVDRASGETTDINMPGPALAPDAIQTLFDQLLTRIERAAQSRQLGGSVGQSAAAVAGRHLRDA